MVGKEFELHDKGDVNTDSKEESDDAMPEPIPTPEEPTVAYIHRLANEGLSKLGAYREMGVSGDVTLIITGGLRTPMDFAKALSLGADGVALANSSIQAIGCVGARICNTNRCPSGIATQDPKLRKRLNIGVASKRLANFFEASIELMKVMARACGHDQLSDFNANDLSSWHKDLAELAGIEWSGFSKIR